MSVTTFGLSPLLHACAYHQGAPVTGDQRIYFAAASDLRALTDSDRELIQVVTGERIPAQMTGFLRRVSFFTLQLALDRIDGPLSSGEDITISYLETVYTAYELVCPEAGNPVSGDCFDLALAFLVGRDLARQDRISLVS